jgi:demethylmenaquinone methyltransferase/2-methoxy-6-polyprenyl-1,4-benzoquinol methylase
VTTSFDKVTARDKPLHDRPGPQRYFRDEQQRQALTRALFDRSADLYDRLEWFTGLGAGSWWRLQVLRHAGLGPRMRVLDVATGTGLVAREALKLIGPEGRLTGLDPSPAMLAEARKALPIEMVLGRAEALPLSADQFDFLCMGYALRHVADLQATFREFLRVLKPGGTACMLEISKPDNPLLRGLLKFHLLHLVPVLVRLLLRRPDLAGLSKYHWETIEACVPPETIQKALETAGFVDVRTQLTLGVFREYYGRKPFPA